MNDSENRPAMQLAAADAPDAQGSEPPQPQNADRGNTRVEKDEAPAARLPHERDASSDAQSADAPQEPAVRQAAYDDAASGRPDTDRAPVTDALYDRNLRGAG